MIGFYDGFFGPGTGSFFVFLLVRLLGYDFLNASVSAKLMNVSHQPGGALLLFALKGHVWWHFAVPLAVANVLGSVLGTWMALRHGAGFVRVIFIVVVEPADPAKPAGTPSAPERAATPAALPRARGWRSPPLQRTLAGLL